MKLSIVIGHNSVASGANMFFQGRVISEHTFYKIEVIPLLTDLYTEHPGEWNKITDLKVFYRHFQGKRKYGKEMRDVYARVNTYDPDANVELHFNAADQSATGTETLHAGTKLGTKLATCMQSSQVKRMALADRGLKVRKRGKRGGHSLWLPKAPSVILEPFFGTNAKDVKRLQEVGPGGVSRMILDGVNNYFSSLG